MRKEEKSTPRVNVKKESKKDSPNLKGLGSALSKIGDALQPADIGDTSEYGVDPRLYRTSDTMKDIRMQLLSEMANRKRLV